MQSRLDETAPTIAQALARELRTEVARGALSPGERITEESLAERFSVSRTPVREALRMLTREQLLEHRPNAGYAVASVSLADMDDLYTVRVAIEERVARHIIERGNDREIIALRAIWEQRPPTEYADASLVSADEQFHETLADASGSSVFGDMLRNINARLHVLRIRDFIDANRVQRTFDQHIGVLNAIRAQNTRLAGALLRAHIWESHTFVRASYLANHRFEDGAE